MEIIGKFRKIYKDKELNFFMLKDIEHKKCREELIGKKCAFCETIFEYSLNDKGPYEKRKDLPKFVFEEDIIEKGRDLAIKEAKEQYIENAEGFIRCLPVCRKHFRILKRDNDLRIKKGIDIPENLEVIKFKKNFI